MTILQKRNIFASGFREKNLLLFYLVKYVLFWCFRAVSCHWRMVLLFISFFTQPSVEERLKMSPWAGFCLLVTQHLMSTTCTVSGLLRRHLEAPSGVYLLFHYPPPHHLSLHHAVSLLICSSASKCNFQSYLPSNIFDLEFQTINPCWRS